MTATTTDTAWKTGDRFTYTGSPALDALGSSIIWGATGTIVRHSHGTQWYVEFDRGPLWTGLESERAGRLWVSEPNITKLSEPEPTWGVGDRFEYAANPSADNLYYGLPPLGVQMRGTIIDTHAPWPDGRTRWAVQFDHKAEGRTNWVSEHNITKLVEPAAETEPAAERDKAVAELAAERDKAVAELAALKATVVRVARKAAAEHDWCGVVDEALREMGLDAEMETTTRVRADIYIEFDVTHDGFSPTGDDVNDAVRALEIPGFDYVEDWYAK